MRESTKQLLTALAASQPGEQSLEGYEDRLIAENADWRIRSLGVEIEEKSKDLFQATRCVAGTKDAKGQLKHENLQAVIEMAIEVQRLGARLKHLAEAMDARLNDSV